VSEESSSKRRHVDLLKTLPEGELKERLASFAKERINLDRLKRDDLVEIILQLQRSALLKLDPSYDPTADNDATFDDDNWNINNWGDFFDHDFDNT